MTAPMAVCRVDGEPLVSTMAFIYKEFVCVVCGRTYDFLEPAGAVPTPELIAREIELRAQFGTERADDMQAVKEAYASAHQDCGESWEHLSGKQQRGLVAAKWVKRHG